MPLKIPPAVNYPSSFGPMPSFAQDEPREGRQQIPIEIAWGTMGGDTKNVSLNVSGTRTRQWTQISTIKVDNSNCGADVTLIFSDTSETIVIPAFAPLNVVPVYSNSLEFFVWSPASKAQDVTRLVILNYADDPTSVNPSDASTTAAFVNMNCLNAVSSVQLVALGINGQLRTLTWYYAQIFGFLPNISPDTSQGDFKLEDGGQVIISSYRVAAYFDATPNQYSVPLLQLSGLNTRFQDGLKITFTPIFGWGSGNLRLNAFGSYIPTS
jgi:hypothetical protein